MRGESTFDLFRRRLVIGCFCLRFLLLIQTVTKLSQMLLKPLHALVGDMNAMTSFELRHEQTSCLTFVGSSEVRGGTGGVESST